MRTEPETGVGKTDYFIGSVAKAFRVLEAFSGDSDRHTLTDLARVTGLNKATVRRLALTLCDLGYLRQSASRHFTLAPRVLDLGEHFLRSLSLPDVAQPFLTDLAMRTHETVNLAVRDGANVLYVNRVAAAQRILMVNLHIGSRLPLHATSLGKALLMDSDRAQVLEILGEPPWEGYTEATRTGPEHLMADLEEAHRVGYAFADGELEAGLRSVAAPVRGAGGDIVAAINISTQTLRTPLNQLLGTMRQDLLTTAGDVSYALGYKGRR